MQIEPDDQLKTPAPTEDRIPRRRFLIWAGAAAALAACTDILTAPLRSRDSLVVQRPNGLAANRLQGFARYPAPAYVPDGYTLLMEQTNRPDGFRRNVGFGEDVIQTALVYRGPRAPKSVTPEQTRYPLVFFATTDTNSHFGGTEGAEGLEYPLRFDDGTQTTARYYDGMWEYPRLHDASGNPIPPTLTTAMEWPRAHWHSLTYGWKEYVVAIRASRHCGASFHEILKVAASTTVVV